MQLIHSTTSAPINNNLKPSSVSSAVSIEEAKIPQYLMPISHTQQPIVTGTSVIAIKYRDGVMMAADCLASYGSLARFRDVQRLTGLSANTLLGSSGDISDYQFTVNMLRAYQIKEHCYDDGHQLSPRQWYTALSSYQYERRTGMNPLWNANIIAGFDARTDERLLAYSDLLGTTYEDDAIATGFGAYLAIPLLRRAVEERGVEAIGEQEAASILEQCLRVLYYRDARALDKVQMAKVAREGVVIGEPYTLASDWSIA